MQASLAAITASHLVHRLKRRFFRAPTYVEAIVRPLVMDAPLDCVIRDISETGAKLQLSDGDAPTGSLFDLEIPSRAERRRCYLVWRTRNVLGVEFVERW